MKRLVFISKMCLFAGILQAQITTNEIPYGLKNEFTRQSRDWIVLTAPDLELIEKEDSINDQYPCPARFAYALETNYTLDNSGEWYQLDDGSKVWQLTVTLPGALSTNTYYDEFWLPAGGKFFVYSEETKPMKNIFCKNTQNIFCLLKNYYFCEMFN